MLLVIEDDPHYARILLGTRARLRGFKGLVANRGQQALALAREYLPAAITLDVFLPDMLGWTVLNNLKLDPRTRHIPVQMLSVEEQRQHGLAHGAFAYLVKPATTGELESAFDKLKSYVAPHTKRLLVIEDNDTERASIVELLGHDDIEIAAVGTGAEALAALRERRFDCCVVDLRLPDMTRLRAPRPAPRRAGRCSDIPIVVFTGQGALGRGGGRGCRRSAKSVVLKDVQSPERLLDETALFLHRVVVGAAGGKRKMIERLHGSTEALRARKVLVVDDDARNIFALTTCSRTRRWTCSARPTGARRSRSSRGRPTSASS